MRDRLLAWRTTLITALLALLVAGAFGGVVLNSLKSDRQHAAATVGQAFALRLVERIHETVGPVFMLAALVRQHPAKVDKFDELAAELLYEFPLIRALELAPGGIVTTVYPLSGNETIIGHDLLKDKKRNREAHMALVKGQLTLAGPFELIQGGLGAVARYPVFVRGTNAKNSFWGFSIAVINVPELLVLAGAKEMERADYAYQLCRVPLNEADGECTAFVQHGEATMDEPVAVRIGLPHNEWVLSLAPPKGWVSMSEKLLVLGLVLIAALVAGAVQFLRQPRPEATTDPKA